MFKRKNNLLKILLFILFILILYLFFVNENFEVIQNIDFYVITLGNEKRLENIKKQTDKLNSNTDEYKIHITKIDAVNGAELDLNKLAEENKIDKRIENENINQFNPKLEIRKKEVGCTMSHIKIYDIIKEKNQPDRYSVIFEDDFNVTDNFLKDLDKILVDLKNPNIDFDILVLGMLGPKGDKVVDNVYKLDCENKLKCYHSHAYIISNKHIDKIINEMNFVNNIMDISIFERATNGKLNVYRVEPNLATQLSPEMGSEIR